MFLRADKLPDAADPFESASYWFTPTAELCTRDWQKAVRTDSTRSPDTPEELILTCGVRLGEGGSAWVYACTIQSESNSPVISSMGNLAVKVFRSGSAGSDAEREANRHFCFSEAITKPRPEVTRFFAAGKLKCRRTNGELFAIVMEQLPSEDGALRPLASLKPSPHGPTEPDAEHSLRVCAAVARSIDTLSQIGAKSFGGGKRPNYSDLKADNIFISEEIGKSPVAVILDHGSWSDAGKHTERTDGVPVTASEAIGTLLGELMGAPPLDSVSYPQRVVLQEIARLKHESRPPLDVSAKRLERAARMIRKRPRRMIIAGISFIAAAALISIVATAVWLEVRWHADAKAARQEFEASVAQEQLAVPQIDVERIDAALKRVRDIGLARVGFLKHLYWTDVLPSEAELEVGHSLTACLKHLRGHPANNPRLAAASVQKLPQWSGLNPSCKERQAVTREAEELLAGPVQADDETCRRLQGELERAPSDDKLRTALNELGELEGILEGLKGIDEIAPNAWKRNSETRELVRKTGDNYRKQLERWDLLKRNFKELTTLTMNESTDSREEIDARLFELKKCVNVDKAAKQQSELIPAADLLIKETDAACNAHFFASTLLPEASVGDLQLALIELDRPQDPGWLKKKKGEVRQRRDRQRKIESWIDSANRCLKEFTNTNGEHRADLDLCIPDCIKEADALTPQVPGDLPTAVTTQKTELVRLQRVLAAFQAAVQIAELDLDQPLEHAPDQGALASIQALRGEELRYAGLALPRQRLSGSIEELLAHAKRRGESSPTNKLLELSKSILRRHSSLKALAEKMPKELTEKLSKLEAMGRQLKELKELDDWSNEIDTQLESVDTVEKAKVLAEQYQVPEVPPDVGFSKRFKEAVSNLTKLKSEAEKIKKALEEYALLEKAEAPSTDKIKAFMDAFADARHLNTKVRKHLDDCRELLECSQALDVSKTALDDLLKKLPQSIDNPFSEGLCEPPTRPQEAPSIRKEVPKKLETRLKEVRDLREQYRQERSLVLSTCECVTALRDPFPVDGIAEVVQGVLKERELKAYNECAQAVNSALQKWVKQVIDAIPSPPEWAARRDRLTALESTPGIEEHIRSSITSQLKTIARLSQMEKEHQDCENKLRVFSIDDNPASLFDSQEDLCKKLNGEPAVPQEAWLEPWNQDLKRRVEKLRSDALKHLDLLSATPPPADENGARSRADWLDRLRCRLKQSNQMVTFEPTAYTLSCTKIADAEAEARYNQLELVWRKLRDNFEWWIGTRGEPKLRCDVGEFLHDCEVWLEGSHGVRDCDQEIPIKPQPRDRVTAVQAARDAVKGTWEVCRKAELLQNRAGEEQRPEVVFDLGESKVSYKLIGPDGFEKSPDIHLIAQQGCSKEVMSVGKWTNHQSVTDGIFSAEWTSGVRYFLGEYDPYLYTFNNKVCGQQIIGTKVTLHSSSTYFIRMPTDAKDDGEHISLLVEIYFKLPAGLNPFFSDVEAKAPVPPPISNAPRSNIR